MKKNLVQLADGRTISHQTELCRKKLKCVFEILHPRRFQLSIIILNVTR